MPILKEKLVQGELYRYDNLMEVNNNKFHRDWNDQIVIFIGVINGKKGEVGFAKFLNLKLGIVFLQTYKDILPYIHKYYIEKNGST